ncbi:methyl-galactoside transport system substrate-binding protein [Alkalispirochaeta americana]|uniref:D-galactose/methyl-galactoside binding periplasmic protein MglB n=1 Tax=Alkalispirochaeta americana TaxID=159291 RepID=A0A1N6U555_9SPIO|nr:galactose ABC transporter substrate-binding protein [Alkalispirochaeta americana]SIQ60720.1 methyl-galactoside transport system substrate-binding protein [Alkalispirochaeta americana]
MIHSLFRATARTPVLQKILVLPMVLLVLAGCQPPAQKVALFPYNLEDPYIRSLVEHIVDETRNTFRLTLWDAQNSQVMQNEGIERAIAEGADLLIVNPVDRLSAYTIILHAREHNIPLIFFNREPLRSDMQLWERVYYVGAKPVQSAELQADLVITLFGGDPPGLNHLDRDGDGRVQTIIFKGEQGHQDAEIRTAGVLSAFEERNFPVEILAIEVANWNTREAYEKSLPLLETYGDTVELIISNNDAMALGVIQRLHDMGLSPVPGENGQISPESPGWIPLVGIDGIDEAVQAIRQGYLYGTVLNDSANMARAISELAKSILSESPEAPLDPPLEEDRYIWIDYQPFIH